MTAVSATVAGVGSLRDSPPARTRPFPSVHSFHSRTVSHLPPAPLASRAQAALGRLVPAVATEDVIAGLGRCSPSSEASGPPSVIARSKKQE